MMLRTMDRFGGLAIKEISDQVRTDPQPLLKWPSDKLPFEQASHSMNQMSFSDFESTGKRKQIYRERFLFEIEQAGQWNGLVALIEPHYPKAGGGGKPYPLETMLRVHLLQKHQLASGILETINNYLGTKVYPCSGHHCRCHPHLRV